MKINFLITSLLLFLSIFNNLALAQDIYSELEKSENIKVRIKFHYFSASDQSFSTKFKKHLSEADTNIAINYIKKNFPRSTFEREIFTDNLSNRLNRLITSFDNQLKELKTMSLTENQAKTLDSIRAKLTEANVYISEKSKNLSEELENTSHQMIQATQNLSMKVDKSITFLNERINTTTLEKIGDLSALVNEITLWLKYDNLFHLNRIEKQKLIPFNISNGNETAMPSSVKKEIEISIEDLRKYDLQIQIKADNYKSSLTLRDRIRHYLYSLEHDSYFNKTDNFLNEYWDFYKLFLWRKIDNFTVINIDNVLNKMKRIGPNSYVFRTTNPKKPLSALEKRRVYQEKGSLRVQFDFIKKGL